jgi:hypothetical protein
VPSSPFVFFISSKSIPWKVIIYIRICQFICFSSKLFFFN